MNVRVNINIPLSKQRSKIIKMKHDMEQKSFSQSKSHGSYICTVYSTYLCIYFISVGSRRQIIKRKTKSVPNI